jgi:hypothetical protein
VAHSGLKRFFQRGLLFALPFLVVLGYTEYKLRAIPNSYNMKRVYLERRLDSIEVLVLGSSQTYDGLNPDLFCCRGFNLGDVGQTLFYDVRLASRYIPRMPRLRCVVIPLSYFSFGYNLEDTGESWRDYYYYHFWDIKASDIKWYDSRSVSFIALYTPKTVLRFAARGFAVNEAAGMQSNGWHRLEETSYESISDSLGHERVKIHDILNKPSRFEGNLRDIAGFLGELKKRGIATAIITPPVYSTYAKHTNPATLAFNRHLIDSLCATYGCVYADFFTDQRFVISDFNDNDHLNVAGAEKFSRILNDEVLVRLCAPR